MFSNGRAHDERDKDIAYSTQLVYVIAPEAMAYGLVLYITGGPQNCVDFSAMGLLTLMTCTDFNAASALLSRHATSKLHHLIRLALQQLPELAAPAVSVVVSTSVAVPGKTKWLLVQTHSC